MIFLLRIPQTALDEANRELDERDSEVDDLKAKVLELEAKVKAMALSMNASKPNPISKNTTVSCIMYLHAY